VSGARGVKGRARQRVKRVYHALRNLPDRLLHQRRHRAVRNALSHSLPPKTILVVCYGNVCRSPYLEAVLHHRLPEIAVRSAGFIGSGRRVPPLALSVSAERRVDLSRHRSRPLSPSSVYSANLIIVMDSRQADDISRRFPGNRAPVVIAGDLDPNFEGTRGITDPWNKSRLEFTTSFARLDRCAATLVSAFARRNQSQFAINAAPANGVTIAQGAPH